MCAVVVKLNSTALLSHVHSPNVPTFLGQNVSMNSAEGAAVSQGFSYGIKKLLISVKTIFKAGRHALLTHNWIMYFVHNSIAC